MLKSLAGTKALVRVAAIAFVWAASALSATAGVITWSFDYHTADHSISASGMLTTSDTLNSLSGYDILGISGARNGVAIAGLASPAGPNPFTISGVPYDNVLFPSDPHFSSFGMVYQTISSPSAPGNFYNLFFDQNYMESFYVPVRVGRGTTLVPFDSVLGYGGIERVPEPGALALVGVALLWMLMLAGYRRRRTESV